jgi:FAD/FMN-containing dehydrogenase
VRHAVDAVSALIARRAVPAAIELVDGDSLRAVESYVGRAVVPPGAGALLIVECDGTAAGVDEEMAAVAAACQDTQALAVTRAATELERDALWHVRRQLSLALRATGLLKINHDVVVPRGRVPELFDVIGELKQRQALRIASFGHAGDGNIHVNLMVNKNDPKERARAAEAERELFERVVSLDGSISGEHGIGFAKARYLSIELSPDEIALMKRLKTAFDPNGILNPGKIFP